jgi:hypothetical protein
MPNNGEQEHKNRIPVIVSICAAIMLSAVIGGIIVYAFINRNDVNDNCINVLKLRNAVVLSYQDARNITSKTKPGPRISQKEIDQAMQFYTRNIKKLRAIECST